MSLLADFHFLRPAWLLLLLPALALSIALYRARRRGGSWQTVIAPALLPYLLEAGPGPGRRGGAVPLLLAAWLLATVAAAGPSWVRQPLPVLQKQDALVVVLDLSYSLWARDLAPSRIDRAQRKVLDLLGRRDEGQTALVAYAGDAHVVAPLTDDGPTLANLLPALDPAMMPVPGADANAAIAAALDLLDAAAVGSGRLLLVTDAIETAEVRAIAERLAGRDVTLSVLGVGTVEGAPIPLPEGGFLKRDDGSIVIPGLPEERLEALARRGGGRYRRIAVDDSDLAALSDASPTGAGDTVETDRRAEGWVDMAHWFLLPLVPLLALAFRRGLLAGVAPLAPLAPLALLLLLPAPAARADLWSDLWYTPDQQGARALAEGEAERAAGLFEDPAWRGTAAYRAGNYADALERFRGGENADSWYNRGNALARAGRLDEAIEAYERSLDLDPGRSDAEANLALVESLRDRQQEQQEQEQRQQGGEDGDPGEQQAGSDPGEQGRQGGDGEPGDPRDNSGDEGQPGSDDGPAGDETGEPSQAETAPEPGQAAPDEGEAGNAARSLEQPAPGIDAGNTMADDIEAEQAMQQWLRRVPDDPSGLLREKFRYESRQRRRRGEERDNGKIW